MRRTVLRMRAFRHPHAEPPTRGRLYVAFLWDSWAPGRAARTALGTVVAATHLEARRRARARWRVPAGPLGRGLAPPIRVMPRSAAPTWLLMEALAADGRALLTP